jgi:hypothetical protein
MRALLSVLVLVVLAGRSPAQPGFFLPQGPISYGGCTGGGFSGFSGLTGPFATSQSVAFPQNPYYPVPQGFAPYASNYGPSGFSGFSPGYAQTPQWVNYAPPANYFGSGYTVNRGILPWRVNVNAYSIGGGGFSGGFGGYSPGPQFASRGPG